MQSTQSAGVLTTRRIVVTGVLAAISILLGATRLGFIPVPNLSGNATIMHVPAIIGGVVEGPIVGALVGFIFGVYSFLQGAEPFWKDPLVSIFPRIFIGVTAYYTYAGLKGWNEYWALAAAGAVGSLTNTVLVVGMLILRGYFAAAVIIPVVIPQAIAEMIIAAAITVAVVAAWKNIETKRKGSSV